MRTGGATGTAIVRSEQHNPELPNHMKERILLVVGCTDLLSQMAQLCVSKGAKLVDEVSSRAAGLQRIDENEYDLVVCDDCLGDGTTDMVIIRMRIKNHNVPIICFSNDWATRTCMWERGCTNVVDKAGILAALEKAMTN